MSLSGLLRAAWVAVPAALVRGGAVAQHYNRTIRGGRRPDARRDARGRGVQYRGRARGGAEPLIGALRHVPRRDALGADRTDLRRAAGDDGSHDGRDERDVLSLGESTRDVAREGRHIL